MSRSRVSAGSRSVGQRPATTISQTEKLLGDAAREHQAGRLEKAKELYLQILALDAEHEKSLFGLGLLAYQVGRFDAAATLIGKATVKDRQNAVYHSSLGLALQAQGRLDEALAAFKHALALQPSNAEAHCNLGTLWLEQGKLKEARGAFERSLAIRPDSAEAHINLGNIFWKEGKLPEAQACYARAVDLRPDRPEAHNNLGNVLREQGDLAGARKHYERSLALKADAAGTLTNLGNVCRSEGKLEEAMAFCERAIAMDAQYAEGHDSLGIVFQDLGRFEEARLCHEEALRLRPDSAEALNNLGAALRCLGRHAEAIACHERALAIRPDWAEARSNLGVVYRAQGKLDEAESHFRRALEASPNSVSGLTNLGYSHFSQCRLREARECYERARAVDPKYPEAQWNHALLELLEGNYAAGWREYETRYQKREIAPRDFMKPRWRGEPLHGERILLHAEQGLGDTIQFLRYVPLVAAAGGSVVLDVPLAALRLASTVPGVTELIATGDALPSFDWHCPLMSLPLAFSTTGDTIPQEVPYLRVPEEARKVGEAVERKKDCLHVGLVWSGNPKHSEDQFRSLRVEQLAPLLDRSGVCFFSLQVGPAAAQVSKEVVDLQVAIHDLADTAALIAALDLVITVDTAVAHLAGALGKPVWMLVPFAPDWRWLMDRRDSAWYPTMRLFRQPRLRDWESVIEQVCSELDALVRSGGAQ